MALRYAAAAYARFALGLAVGLGVSLGLTGAAPAQTAGSAALDAAIASHVLPLLEEPRVITAVRAQNARTADYDQAEIDRLDSLWRAEIGTAERPTIAPVVDSALSQVLANWVQASDGRVTELFVMDARGLNVAVSHVTSDYWQGDEAKFQDTVPRGAGAIHVGEVAFDESSQHYLVQVSVTVMDPDTGVALGALTAGLNAEMLE